MYDPWNHDASRGRVYPIVLAVLAIMAAAGVAAWFVMEGEPDHHAGGSSKVERVDARVLSVPFAPVAMPPSRVPR